MSTRTILKFTVLAIIMFIGILVSCPVISTPTHAVNWNTYYSQENGFSIDYPNNSTGKLTVTPNPNLNETTVEFPNSGFEANLTVTNKTGMDLSQFVLQDFNHHITSDGNESIHQGISNLTNGGLTYSLLISEGDAGHDRLIKKSFLEHDDKIFTFWFRDNFTAFDNSTYNTMSNSIKFLD